MINSIKHIAWLMVGIVLLSACNVNEPTLFKAENSFVAFLASEASVEETDQILEIPVMVSSVLGAPAITVNFELSTDDLAEGTVEAVEGEDFLLVDADGNTITSKTLSYGDGFGYDTIRVVTIDNDEFTGTKKFQLIIGENSEGYANGSEDVLTISISDDDHPLGWMLGNYTATGELWRAGGTASWSMKLEPVEGDVTQVAIQGLVSGGGYGHDVSDDYVFYGTVDSENMTLTIKTGQTLDSWGYGPVVLVGWYGPDGATAITEGDPVTCDIVVDGDNITINPQDEYGTYITEGTNEGLYLEIVIDPSSSLWTKN